MDVAPEDPRFGSRRTLSAGAFARKPDGGKNQMTPTNWPALRHNTVKAAP